MRAPTATKGSVLQGFHYVWSRPDLRATLIMLFLIGTFGLNFPIFISTMAVGVFHTDARGFGLLSSMMAIGTMSGALLAASRERPRFTSLLAGAAIFGLGCTLAALAPDYWLFAAALVVIGVASLTVINTSNALMQLSTEPAMRGRVMALRLGVALGGTPIGAPIVGWVADHFGPRWALGVGAAAGFAAALVAIGALSRSASANRTGITRKRASSICRGSGDTFSAQNGWSRSGTSSNLPLFPYLARLRAAPSTRSALDGKINESHLASRHCHARRVERGRRCGVRAMGDLHHSGDRNLGRYSVLDLHRTRRTAA